MYKKAFMEKLEEIIEESKTALLSTIDDKGYPTSRWMSPILLPGKDEYIYAITASSFPKTHQINNSQKVEWLFQKKDLREIMNIKGKINVIDNPSIKKEILEIMGDRLGVFWKINEDVSDMVVLETEILYFKYFKPMKGAYDILDLRGE